MAGDDWQSSAAGDVRYGYAADDSRDSFVPCPELNWRHHGQNGMDLSDAGHGTVGDAGESFGRFVDSMDDGFQQLDHHENEKTKEFGA